jgi:hypothetical protein
MADSEKMSADQKLLELAKLSQADFENRRNLEWKLSLGLWGAIGLFVYTAIGNEKLRSRIADVLRGHPCFALLLIALIATLHGCIMRVIQKSNDRDKKYYRWYREALEGTLDDRPPSIPPPTLAGRFKWFVYHIFITLMVLAGAWLLLSIAP